MLRLRLLLALLAVAGLWLVVPVGNSMAGQAEVQQIQQRLTDLGYDPGPVDGSWGAKTERAAKRFLESRTTNSNTVFTARGRNEAVLLNLLRSDAKTDRSTGTAAEIVLQTEHSSFPDVIAYAPKGRILATGSSDKTIKIWDANNRRLIRTLIGHHEMISVLGFSDEGEQIISVDQLGEVRIWDVVTGSLLRRFTTDEEEKEDEVGVYAGGAITPSGSRLLVDNIRTLDVWEPSKVRRVQKIDRFVSSEPAIAISGDGAHAALGGHNILASLDGEARFEIALWEINTNKKLYSVNVGADRIQTLKFSPDGSVLAVGTSSSLSVHDAKNGRLLRNLGSVVGVQALAFSPDGRFIAACRGSIPLELWDISTGELVRSSKDNPKCSASMAFAPHGQAVATGAGVWDLDSGRFEKLGAGRQDLGLLGASFVKQTSQIISNNGSFLSFWDTVTGARVSTVGNKKAENVLEPNLEINSFAVLSDGSMFAVDDIRAKRLRVFRTSDKTPVTKFNIEHLVPKDAIAGIAIDSMSAPPSGKSLVSRNRNGTISIWSIKDGKETRNLKVGKYAGAGIAMSLDGSRFASTGHGATLLLFDGATGGQLKTFKADHKARHHRGTSLAISPTNDQLVEGGAAELALVSLRTGRYVRYFIDKSIVREGLIRGSLRAAHSDVIEAVAYSPDGRWILSGSRDNTAKLWDAKTGRLLRTFTGHQSAIRSIGFLETRTRFMTASDDGTVKIWSTRRDQPLATLMETDKGWLAVTPEGFFAGTREVAKALIVVRGLDSFAIDQFYQALYRPDLVKEKLADDPDGKVAEAIAKLNLETIIDSGGAPSVDIASTADGTSITNDKLTVEAKISDVGGGIGRIEWRVNGVTLGVHTKRGFERVAEDVAQAGGKSFTVSQDVWLEPGENTIEVVAYNAKNLIASEPAKITVTWDGQSSNAQPRLHVLAVGINDYFDSRLKLNFAVPDANAVSAALSKAGSGLYEEVSVTSVLDGDATAKGLERAFESLAKNVRPRDVFVFFLAGHGKTVDGRYYFIPQDFRYKSPQSIIDSSIGQDEWQRWLSKIPARKSLLLYDTCESGSLTGTRIATRGLERVAALEKLTRAMGRTVLSAASDDAPALEGYRGHGVFTYSLLDALNRADANKNDLIEITELAGHVDAQVPKISQTAFGQRQLPQMNIVGSNFPLAKRTATLGAKSPDLQKPAVAKAPTHMVIKPSDLFAEAGGVGAAIRRLKPGTMVTLIRTDLGWSLIARGGKKLGYVTSENLLAPQ